MRKLLVVLAAGLLAVPAITIAGKKATAGDQSLQIAAKVAPPKAGTKKKPRGVMVKLDVDYRSLNEGAQISENPKNITFSLAKGTTVHTEAAGVCLLSALMADGPTACPADSKVGDGTATADARPTLPDPVGATVTMFNGSDDVNPDGTPRDPGIPAVILYAETEIPGVNAILPFDVHGNELLLEYAPPEEGASSLFHVQTVAITFPKPKAGTKPYITAPTTCKKTWLVAMTVENYDGPTVTATHKLNCKKA
jgi:hypothetical protein